MFHVKQRSAISARAGNPDLGSGFGLYVHWPFCTSKCPYCDFNSHVSKVVDYDKWLDGYRSEIRRFAEIVPNRTLDTVFFGGGTPSLMPPFLVEAILESASSFWSISEATEISLEANPGSTDLDRFKGYRSAGVNRLSIGVQSLIDRDLGSLGRTHTAAHAHRAIETARSVYDRVSCDLILARQYQSADAWSRELEAILDYQLDHLSLYQLTIEDGTIFKRRQDAGKLPAIPHEDSILEMFDVTEQLCTAAGLAQYEISNWARPGQECAHNLIYWRSGDYVGVGPGAHGRLTIGGKRYATVRPSDPAIWLNDSMDKASQPQDIESVPPHDWATEYILMGLRMAEGISLKRYETLQEKCLEALKVNELIELGLVKRSGDILACTASGRRVLNAVVLELIPS